ncbi:ion channel [Jeotgalicoccus sp. WY2]|uniref:ion channel n=1 Tax=Jeotgalicoccus sp. WY2 TaxID=2708346 RepID=UPI001BD2B180
MSYVLFNTILIDSNQGTIMKDHNLAEMIYYSGSTLLSIGYGDLNPLAPYGIFHY